MASEQPDNVVHVDPDVAVALLLAFVKNQLQAEVQVHGFDVVHIFLGRVAGATHKADDLPRLNQVSLLQARRKGGVLFQVRIVIIPPAVQGANAIPLAAVLIPAHGLHGAGLYGHNGSAYGAHQLVAQVQPGNALAPADDEMVEVAVAVAGRTGRKCIQHK